MTDRTGPWHTRCGFFVRYARRPAHEVTGISAYEWSCAGNGQVFGLAGTSARDGFLLAVASRIGRIQCV